VCTMPSDRSTVCNSEASTLGHWVSTFQAPRWDSLGNLTYAEGIYTGTPIQLFLGTQNRRQMTWTYDPNYQGLVATATNALGQVTSHAYDAQARLYSTTDVNHQVTNILYDVYGRPRNYIRPGTAN